MNKQIHETDLYILLSHWQTDLARNASDVP